MIYVTFASKILILDRCDKTVEDLLRALRSFDHHQLLSAFTNASMILITRLYLVFASRGQVIHSRNGSHREIESFPSSYVSTDRLPKGIFLLETSPHAVHVDAR